MPTALKTNFADESRPSPWQPLYPPLKVRGSSIYDLSIVKTASQLERTIKRWASEVLFIAPVPAATLQEAVLADITDVGESTALFSDVHPTTVQCLLRHALAQVISEDIINSLIVTNSVEENVGLTRVHERLLTQNLAAAAAWRRHTYSIAVEIPRPELLRIIFEQNMPLLAALLPDSTEDLLGTRGVLEDAFKFSCMLRGANADSDALYRSFVPKLASPLDPGRVELVKPCGLRELGVMGRVGVTIFPGLVEVLPTPLIAQTVVRRAQVICECELPSNPVSALPPPPKM